ncbi:MAG: PEP-CTERM sorting domain-containing protein [Microcystis aeruginosa Ma_QC_C_20070703_M131]|uniref:PEP-CTERM sorting domain-containing protein n=1 Tax=Microcystis aeruginosa Ma_QC_C_20070703_M131 TaxID=2486263 RepID=A0A551YKJ3_MICAE|nr:MAG: PEP-CTERM sorting domain-containing protein [Microcystis aeruginosa Ma_QC_C_20070703_M131]
MLNCFSLLPAPCSPAILTSNLDSQQLITPSNPSPEPGTIVPLLGLGLGALASRGKKQG